MPDRTVLIEAARLLELRDLGRPRTPAEAAEALTLAARVPTEVLTEVASWQQRSGPADTTPDLPSGQITVTTEKWTGPRGVRGGRRQPTPKPTHTPPPRPAAEPIGHRFRPTPPGPDPLRHDDWPRCAEPGCGQGPEFHHDWAGRRAD